jgi:hypothetical protein
MSKQQLSSDLASLRIQRDEDPERGSTWKKAVVGVVLLAAVFGAYRLCSRPR